MTDPGKGNFLLRAWIVLRLGLSATFLALLGGTLCALFLQSSLQLGPDQLGGLVVAVLVMVPLVLAVNLVFVFVSLLPMYRALRPIESGELISTDQALAVWNRVHHLPRQAMILSALMWVAWTVFVGWWLVRNGTLGLDDAILAIPCCIVLGMTNAIGFFFRSRAILRPVQARIGGHLPPEFEPVKIFPIKRKLAMGFLYICSALGLSLGVEILLWHQRGANELALSIARERMETLVRQPPGERPALAEPTVIGGITFRPFLLGPDGRPAVGVVRDDELELIQSSPRLLGLREWQENHWLEAEIANLLGRFLATPEHAQLRNRGFGRSDLVLLDRQPLPGGLRLGAVIAWDQDGAGGGRQELAAVAMIFVFTIIALVVAALWTYWVTSDVIDPVENLSRVIRDGINHSNPGRTTMISDDEIGRLSASFNRMSLSLSREMNEGRRLLEALRGATGKINEIMRGIVEVASDQAAGATEQAASLHQVTTTSEEIAVTLRSIAEHSRTVEEVAGKSLSSCYDGQAHLGNVNAGMETAQQRAHDVADKMLSFQEHANRIENILEFIREVSERINLISLNASIEASSAGETGSRFSIIASEMRKLAEKTMNGTKEIRSTFSDLQSSASSAIIATEEGEKQVELARRLNEQAASSFQSIIHWAGETARAAQEISLSSSQQTTATDHLASALGEINDVAANFAESSKALENSISELEKISEEMGALLISSREPGGRG